MIAASLFLSAALAQSGTDPAPEIVVRAVRGRCEIVYAGSRLDGRGLQRLADGWPAGAPLRVQEPRRADRKCLVRVALMLSEQGFNNIQFVEPATAP